MISFHQEDIKVKIAHKRSLISWIKGAIAKEGFIAKSIAFILTSDAYLLRMNEQFLNHTTYTDVITFPYSNGIEISGDIFISWERIIENANSFGVTPEHELHRVMIHGTLHLCGYQDNTPELKKQMSTREDKYLSLRSFL